MTRLAIGVGLVVVAALASFYAGQWRQKVKDTESSRAAYEDILRRINDESLDTSDDAAVLAELCRLAGLEPVAPECSALRGN